MESLDEHDPERSRETRALALADADIQFGNSFRCTQARAGARDDALPRGRDWVHAGTIVPRTSLGGRAFLVLLEDCSNS